MKTMNKCKAVEETFVSIIESIQIKDCKVAGMNYHGTVIEFKKRAYLVIEDKLLYVRPYIDCMFTSNEILDYMCSKWGFMWTKTDTMGDMVLVYEK